MDKNLTMVKNDHRCLNCGHSHMGPPKKILYRDGDKTGYRCPFCRTEYEIFRWRD